MMPRAGVGASTFYDVVGLQSRSYAADSVQRCDDAPARGVVVPQFDDEEEAST